jgi:hypothetical protein
MMYRNYGQCLNVKMDGEEADDEGGPFKALFENMAEELQSCSLPLLIATEN